MTASLRFFKIASTDRGFGALFVGSFCSPAFREATRAAVLSRADCCRWSKVVKKFGEAGGAGAEAAAGGGVQLTSKERRFA